MRDPRDPGSRKNLKNCGNLLSNSNKSRISNNNETCFGLKMKELSWVCHFMRNIVRYICFVTKNSFYYDECFAESLEKNSIGSWKQIIFLHVCEKCIYNNIFYWNKLCYDNIRLFWTAACAGARPVRPQPPARGCSVVIYTRKRDNFGFP